MDQRGLYGS